KVNDEVLIRAVGELTHLKRHGRPGTVREITLGKLAQNRLVFRVTITINAVRVHSLLEVVVAAELEPRYAEDRQTVVVPVFDGDDEHGKAVWREPLRMLRLQPRQHLTFGDRQTSEPRDQFAGPRTGAHDQALGRIGGAAGSHHDAFLERLPI